MQWSHVFFAVLLLSVSTRALESGKFARRAERAVVERPHPDLSCYHGTDQLAEEIRNLAKSCPLLKLENRQGKSKELLSVSIKRPNTDAVLNKKPLKVLMFFGEHARELISPETALRFLQLLCGASSKKGHPAPDADTKKMVEQVLADSELLMFPLINEDGHHRATRGGYCMRTNKKGVDLNRNWDDHWKGKQSGDTFGGSKAFSEDEVRILRDAAHEFKPEMFVSIHSGALGMYTPYAYSEAAPKSDSQKDMVRILKELNPSYCNCDVGAAGAQLHYLCPGTCLDYMYDKLKTPYAFAVEIWDGNRGGYKRKSTPFGLLEKSASTSRLGKALRRAHNKHGHKNNLKLSEEQSKQVAEGSCFLMMNEHVHHKAKHTREHDHSKDEEYDRSNVLFPQPDSAETHSCLTTFNPTSSEQYIETTDNWSRALLELINKVRDHHHSL